MVTCHLRRKDHHISVSDDDNDDLINDYAVVVGGGLVWSALQNSAESVLCFQLFFRWWSFSSNKKFKY